MQIYVWLHWTSKHTCCVFNMLPTIPYSWGVFLKQVKHNHHHHQNQNTLHKLHALSVYSHSPAFYTKPHITCHLCRAEEAWRCSSILITGAPHGPRAAGALSTTATSLPSQRPNPNDNLSINWESGMLPWLKKCSTWTLLLLQIFVHKWSCPWLLNHTKCDTIWN